MSVVQTGIDLGSTSLASEYKKTADSEVNASLVISTDSNKAQVLTAVKAAEEDDDKKVANTQPLTVEQLEKVAQQLQDFIGTMNRGLEFSVDKDSGRDVIKVIDKNSGDLVKQFPSEEVLTLVAKLSEMVGGFIDAKV